MGIRTTNLNRQYSIDELIGNVTDEGVLKTGRIPLSALASQMAGTGAFITGNVVWAGSLAQLTSITPPTETSGGMVLSVSSPTESGYYIRSGGFWVRRRGLADTLGRLTVTGGTANAVTASVSTGVDPSEVLAFFIDIPEADENTGNVTIAVNGAAAIPALDYNGNQFASGTWVGRILLSNEGTHLQALTSAADAVSLAAALQAAVDAEDAADRAELAAAGVEFPVSYAVQALTAPQQAQARANIGVAAAGDYAAKGHIFGLPMSRNGSDSQNLDVAAGEASSDASTPALMVLSAAITKRLDAAWAVGTGNGMLDTGAIASNTTYHIFLIQRSDTGVEDVLASTSPTAPTMPAGYDHKRRIGSVITDGSSLIKAFYQVGGWFYYIAPEMAWGTEGIGTTAELLTAPVPVGIKVMLEAFAQVTGASTDGYLAMCDPDNGNADIFDAVISYNAAGDAGRGAGVVRCWTDTLARVSVYSNASATMGNSFIRGWFDARGVAGGGLAGI